MTTSFSMAPVASGSWAWALIVIPLALVLGVALFVLVASFSGSRNASFEVSERGLTLRGDLYGRTVPRAAIQSAGVRLVDLDREPKLVPKRRTFGTALPGYRSGWFRLADGEKALLYVTDRSHVVYVPTTEGYSLLLSPADPAGLVASLRAFSP